MNVFSSTRFAKFTFAGGPKVVGVNSDGDF